MSDLVCDHYDYEPGPGDLCWYRPLDFSTYSKRRSTRCASCGKRIALGDTVAEWAFYKIPGSDIELRIYGEDGEISRASEFHCEDCAGLAFSLMELGYAVRPGDDVPGLVSQYAAMQRAERERPDCLPDAAGGTSSDQQEPPL